MAKPPRSPLLGYNHNISHLGRVFHVQTEDSGPLAPRLFTHMFFEGTILASVRLAYDPQTTDDKVRLLMQNQHKAMIRDLMQARFDERLVAFFRARGQELALGAGALPSTPMPDTPAPLLAAEAAEAGEQADRVEASEVFAGPSQTEAAEAAAAEAESAAAPSAVAPMTTASFVAEPASEAELASESEDLARSQAELDAAIPLPISGAQRETRPFASQTSRSRAGASAALASPAGSASKSASGAIPRTSTSAPRRSPFVRAVDVAAGGAGSSDAKQQPGKAPKRSVTAAAMDTVVVQRTVRVGGAAPAAPPSRSERVRRPAAFALVGRDAAPAPASPSAALSAVTISAEAVVSAAEPRAAEAPEAMSSADHTLRHASLEGLPAVAGGDPSNDSSLGRQAALATPTLATND